MQAVNNPDGFTLFELMVVLIIAGLMSAFVIPRFFGSMSHIELKSAARETVTLLSKARNLAYFEKRTVKVKFDLEKNSAAGYRKKGEENVAENGLAVVYPKDIRIIKYKDIKSEDTFDSFEILFSPRGNSSGGIVTLGNQKRTYEIEIDLITGSSRILD